jgi:hypothetical protein
MFYNQVAVSIFALFLASSTAANNGTFVYEFTQNFEPGYLECAGEEIEVTLNVTVRSHTVVSSSGHFHYVENWSIEGEAIGLSSLNKWYAHGYSPLVLNSKAPQQSGGYVIPIMYEPLDGQTKIREKWKFRAVVDANGMLRVLDGGEAKFYCLGN